jgi:hypothetical protein
MRKSPLRFPAIRRWAALLLLRLITDEDEPDVERKAFYDRLYAKIDAMSGSSQKELPAARNAETRRRSDFDIHSRILAGYRYEGYRVIDGC